MAIFNVNLNIHYSAPKEMWDKIEKCYSEMPYWKGFVRGCPQWCAGPNKYIEGSIEPSGLQLHGEMSQEEWDGWLQLFRERLTKVLGYAIGEPEDGYSFKYWEPFIKKYADIKIINNKQIVFNDYSTFYWEQFERCERDITANPPYFVFKSSYIELRVYFDDAKTFLKNKRIRLFQEFQRELKELGISTLDLS